MGINLQLNIFWPPPHPWWFFNAYHPSWYSRMDDSINGSDWYPKLRQHDESSAKRRAEIARYLISINVSHHLMLLARTNSASSIWSISDLERSNTSPTSQSRHVRSGSIHWSCNFRNLARTPLYELCIGLSRFSAHPRKYWSRWFCPLSTNISNLLLTYTVLDQITRPPPLCRSWQQTSQWDTIRRSPLIERFA